MLPTHILSMYFWPLKNNSFELKLGTWEHRYECQCRKTSWHQFNQLSDLVATTVPGTWQGSGHILGWQGGGDSLIKYHLLVTPGRQKQEFIKMCFGCQSFICFTWEVLRFLDSHRVPLGTEIVISDAKCVLLGNIWPNFYALLRG